MTYTPKEREYIKLELKRLETARNDDYKGHILTEWINSFEEEGFIAEHACRMVRKVRLEGATYKVKFSDFVNCFESAMELPPIMPVKMLPEKKEDTPTNRELICNVRHVLGISFVDFLIEMKEKGYESSTDYYNYLLEHPNETKCIKLDQKYTKARSGKIISLSQAIKNGI